MSTVRIGPNRQVTIPQDVLEKMELGAADDLNLAWHRIDTWPDVVPGFKRLQRKFMLAPCSNGNIALMVDIARPSSFHSTCDDCCKEEER